ncbi:four helix bundle protein, partial [Candidatus Peregrinibacteria bacterium]|nr:four helix bundle protein [Candidatus Peregrinibacteria bacterium]
QSVYAVTKNFPYHEQFGLTSQMRRAAVSVPSNIAEGSQRRSDKEFAGFLLIAKGSLAELRTQALLAEHLNYLQDNVAKTLMKQMIEIDKMLRAFHRKLV